MPDTKEDFTSEVSEGANLRTVHCKHCNSIILEPSFGKCTNVEVELPTVAQKKDDTTTTKETLSWFWEVENMFTFINIGFSNTVGNTKYLTCADCDIGPIGYHDLDTKKSFVALSRVAHR